MQDRVELLGRIDNPSELTRYYAEAIASVSFGQAGLAVLQSMAFGVPFITKENAISGGEKYNIINGETGILVKNDPAALEAALRRLFADIDAARRLGKAAYHYYSEAATVENMVANFIMAINAAMPAHD
jgi:glycosyltransferase involved in cell wall biosynthesis